MKVIKRDQRQADAGKLQQGFTLIELVIVLAVLGVLAAIAVPQLTGLQGEARLAGTAATVSGELNNAFSKAFANNKLKRSQNANGIDWERESTPCNDSSLEDAAESITSGDFKINASGNGVSVTVPFYKASTDTVESADCSLVEVE